MSVHRNIITNYSQQDATFLEFIFFTDAVHVSGSSSAHHQEHKTVHTALGIVKQFLKLYIQLCALHLAVNKIDKIPSYCQRDATLLGNKTYYANQFFFKRKLVSKKSKLKCYCSIIRPTVTDGCETWGLKDTIKNQLMVFERKVLRRIFGPTKERDGTWRIKTNNELDELIRHKNIINHIKAQTLSWFGHLHRMPEERMV
jgi:hypothetical protein